MDYSLPGSSVHGMLQAKILEWVAIPFSKRSFQPWDWTWVSSIAGRFFTVWTIKHASNVYVREWKKKGSSTETLCKLHYLSDIWVLGVLMHSLLLSWSLQPPHINVISLSYFLLQMFFVQRNQYKDPVHQGLVLFSCSVMSYSLQPHGLQHESFTMSLLKLMSILSSLLRLMSIELVMPPRHLILCCPLLLLPSIFLSIRVFSSESAPSSGSQNIRV